MPLSTMLFSFSGRLNRARFWLASIVLIVVSVVLLPISILSAALVVISPASFAILIGFGGWPVMPAAFAGLQFVLCLYLLVSCAALLAWFAGFAVATKRLHDRNKSAWWLLLFYLAPLILAAIAYYTDPGGIAAFEVRLILGLAGLSIWIWFLVEFGFLRGTAGPNRYGPDPLWIGPAGSAAAGRPAARFATFALMTLLGVAFVADWAVPIAFLQSGRWFPVLTATSSSRGPQAIHAFSDFVTDVNRNQVADVTIQGNTINGHFTDGRAFSFSAPNRLITKGVRIDAAPVSPRGLQAILAFSDSLNDVDSGQVADVTIHGNGITGHFSDGDTFSFGAPKEEDLKGIRITVAPVPPGMSAAPNEAQRRPQPPAAPNEAQGQPQPPAPPNAAAENGITGVWTANNVGFPPWTLTLKAEGAILSGTVQQGAGGSSGRTTLTTPAAIYDGEIDGNKITFKCQDPWRHDRTITFTGIVNGDAITFTRTVLVRSGGNPGTDGIFGVAGAAEFTAQRAVLSAAASVPAVPNQRHAVVGEARFVKIDISDVANSELDWLLRLPRGQVKFDGIPFTILSGDRSVIHMRNRVRPDYPSTLRAPIGVASVAWVHLLLCGDRISNPGQHVGTVRISYSDGSSRDIPLISLEDIRETWMPNFSLSGHPFSGPPEGVTWQVAYSESQMRSGMASTAFLDRLSIRTDPARTISDVSFLTNEPQTGMILIAMTLEITSGAVPSSTASAKPD
jgi:uncharacterized membrane protein YhaH (DUF805 family)